jgi:Xaa-Pro dipeptidase
VFPETTSACFDRRSLLAGAGAFGLAACVGGGSQKADEAAGRDELFAHLTDQSRSVEPITEAERSARRTRLGTLLARAGADALLMEPGPTLTYLAGVSWGKSERLFALVVLANGSHFWLVPEFEASRARLLTEGPDRPGGRIVTWREDQYAIPALVDAFREMKIERVMVEPQMRLVFDERLGEAFGFGDARRVLSGREVVIELRSVKDAHELQLMERANELTKLAIDTVAESITPGLDGHEIGARMDLAHKKLGMRSPWNLSLVGPAAALPHGESTPRKIARGDVLLIDTGAALHGYQSDVTRTWIFGGVPNVEAERVWQCVRDTQQAAIDAIRPGVEARAIDALARASVAARGYDAGYRDFTHRLGHGIGLEGHEDPYFDGGSRTILRPGMTLSVEPGLYFPGRFGVRIEDIIAVTDAGARVFGRRQENARSPS